MRTVDNYLKRLGLPSSFVPKKEFAEAVAILNNARVCGRFVFTMGNGGSGSTASHFANDLLKGTDQYGKPRIKAMSLNDPMPTISAYSNDLGYEHVFAEQLKAFIGPDDVVIGISGSGKSRNVLEAMKVAKRAGAIRVGLTGFYGGELMRNVDISLHTSARSMPRAEDTHFIWMHLISECIKNGESPPLPKWYLQRLPARPPRES